MQPLKDEKAKTVLNGFIGTVIESKHKLNNSFAD